MHLHEDPRLNVSKKELNRLPLGLRQAARTDDQTHKVGVNRYYPDGMVEMIITRMTELQIHGKNKTNVVKIICKEFDVTAWKAQAIWEDACVRLKEQADDDIYKQRTLAIRRFELLFSKCLDAEDFRGAKEVQVEMVKLFGLNEPSRLEISAKPIASMSDDEIRKMLGS